MLVMLVGLFTLPTADELVPVRLPFIYNEFKPVESITHV